MPGSVGVRARRSRARARLGALAVALSFARAAGAASTEVQAVGATSLGVSDNISAAPDVPLPGGAEKTGGMFLVLRPGVVVGFLSPRSVQRLAYTFDYDVYLSRSASTTTSNRLEYRGFFDVAPGLNALLGAAATESDSYAALTLAPPASGLLPLLPAGTSQVLAASVDEVVSYQFSPGWRGSEGVDVVLGMPLFGGDAPTTLAPRAKLGAEYSWTGDAVGVEARGAYSSVWNATSSDGTHIDRARELTLGGVATARHDLGRFFTSGLEGGAFRVTRLESDQSHVYPTAAARLDYADVIGDAQLSYTHALSTNVLLGQTLLSDELRLRGGLPLDSRGEFSLGGSVGYQRGRLLDENAELATRVSLLLVDVTLGWQLEPWLLVGLRAQHVDQRSDTRVAGLPVSFVQNNLMLGAALSFPPDREMPARYRAPRRVDRGDEVRGAAQPATDSVAAPAGRAR